MLAVFAAGASADDINLPDMGSPADALLSKSVESQIGRAIMRDIRRSGMVVEDPQITEYINEIGHRIAVQSNDGDYEFTFFVVDDPRINAFALPGGYIGVHTGLIEASRNEDELAGVIAHEVAYCPSSSRTLPAEYVVHRTDARRHDSRRNRWRR